MLNQCLDFSPLVDDFAPVEALLAEVPRLAVY